MSTSNRIWKQRLVEIGTVIAQQAKDWIQWCNVKRSCRNKSIVQLNSRKKWCKYALDIFVRNKTKAKHHRVTRLSAQQQSYQVDTPHNPGTAGHGDHTHGVNLLQRICTCQKWKLYRIPCSHVIAQRRTFIQTRTVLKVVDKEAHPNGKVKKGKVVYGVVVRAAMQRGRCDGSGVKFDDNAMVLVDKQGQPISTRVFAPVPHELRKRKHVKILTLAEHIA
ncbi:50s ribosomal protein hlp [Quercus suber]|uniref:50s ribosomal protein hlp n=1 Tax=Quercus suber TaxID=58331 RepID=A0AAW0JGC6_QUESU